MNPESVIQIEVRRKKKNHTLTSIYGISANGTDEHNCNTGIEMHTLGMDLWAHGGKERVGQIEKVALHITLCKLTN